MVITDTFKVESFKELCVIWPDVTSQGTGELMEVLHCRHCSMSSRPAAPRGTSIRHSSLAGCCALSCAQHTSALAQATLRRFVSSCLPQQAVCTGGLVAELGQR